MSGFLLTRASIVGRSEGAIFTEEQRGSSVELVFKYAVERVNADADLLPNSTLVYHIHYVDPSDTFHASKKSKASSTQNIIEM